MLRFLPILNNVSTLPFETWKSQGWRS